MARKRTPPRPKSTANLPKGLAAYWAKKGVPSKPGGSSSSSKSTKSKTAKKRGRKKKRTTKKSN